MRCELDNDATSSSYFKGDPLNKKQLSLKTVSEKNSLIKMDYPEECRGLTGN